MQWVERRREAYRHPDGVMPGTRSVIMAAMNYNDGAEPAGGGRVARYAWGSADYHDVLKPRLLKLADLLRSEVPTARTRVVIDTAPLLERDFGRLAGIVLGNAKDRTAEPELLAALDDEEPLIREAAAWALGELGQ